MTGIAFIPLPFGLRDVKLYPLTAEVAGPSVDLPNSRTFSFAEAESQVELRGDDGLVAIHGTGPSVNWELEGGGISFEAVKTMYGGTITSSGTTPAQIKTYSKKGTDSRPYFQVQGKAISDSGGDFTVKLYRCHADGDLAGRLGDGVFWLTGAKGKALPQLSDSALYDFIQNEQFVALT